MSETHTFNAQGVIYSLYMGKYVLNIGKMCRWNTKNSVKTAWVKWKKKSNQQKFVQWNLIACAITERLYKYQLYLSEHDSYFTLCGEFNKYRVILEQNPMRCTIY